MRRVTFVGAAILALSLGGVAAKAGELLSCPIGEGAGSSVRYVSFFDGEPSEMIELAPDDASQGTQLDLTWQFPPQRSRPLVMVCSYADKPQTSRVNVPDGVSVCRLSGAMDEAGTIQGLATLVCQ